MLGDEVGAKMGHLLIPLAVLSLGPPSATDEPKPARVAKGQDEFARDLYARLRLRPGNLCLSPPSIRTALAMTYAGARGETAEQIARTLHFEGPPERLHASIGAWSKPLRDRGPTGPDRLAVANALWLQQDERILPEFSKLLADHYESGLRRVDFRSGDRARRTINSWVEGRTGGLIRDLVLPPEPAPGSVLILTNALYYKADWAEPFPRGATRPEDFTIASDQVIRVPMMHTVGRLAYLDGGSFEALELPYAGDTCSMVLLLPRRAGGLAGLEGTLTRAKLVGLRPRRVEVAMPRFRIETGRDLRDTLSAMGMPLAFSRRADFSGINGRRDLFLSAVIHRATVEVNEEGTEAAAAAESATVKSDAPPPEKVVTFRADHPFLFLIRERQTGSLLFVGRVVNPRG